MPTPNLARLIATNQRKVKNTNQVYAASGTLNLVIDDVISGDDWYGWNANTAAYAVRNSEYNNIHMVINSPGGDVFPAMGLVSALRTCGKPVTCDVVGVAASAASVIAMAASEIKMYDGAFMMIHNAWSVCVGNSKDMNDLATLLGNIDKTLANEYMKTVNRLAGVVTLDEVVAMMDAETWIPAAEAVSYGLADSVYTGVSPSASKHFDLSAYANAPAALLEPTEPNSAGILATLSRKLKLLGG